jgi:hypothetical protein
MGLTRVPPTSRRAPCKKGVRRKWKCSPFCRLLSRVAQGPVLASMSHPGATRNWVCFASRGPNTSTLVLSKQKSCGRSQIGFVWRFSRASGSLPLHWPLVTGHSPLFQATRPIKNTPLRAPPFGWGDARAASHSELPKRSRSITPSIYSAESKGGI